MFLALFRESLNHINCIHSPAASQNFPPLDFFFFFSKLRVLTVRSLTSSCDAAVTEQQDEGITDGRDKIYRKDKVAALHVQENTVPTDLTQMRARSQMARPCSCFLFLLFWDLS